MSITAPTRTHLTALSLVMGAIACSPDTTTAPGASTVDSPKLAIATSSVLTVQLRGLPPNPVLPPNPIYGYGHLQLRLGASLGDSCLPPNPVTPQPGFTLVTVCGKIFNEGGALYRGGGIYQSTFLGDSFTLVAAFNGAIPNVPCRRYDIGGTVEVSDAVALDMIANPTTYRVGMDGEVAGAPTTIGGLLDGSAWGPVGSRPETDPFFAVKVCNVAVTP